MQTPKQIFQFSHAGYKYVLKGGESQSKDERIIKYIC